MFVYIKENEMKKVALSLLAFALVGAMAFGQDAAAPALKIGGYLDIGTLTTMNADSGTNPTTIPNAASPRSISNTKRNR